MQMFKSHIIYNCLGSWIGWIRQEKARQDYKLAVKIQLLIPYMVLTLTQKAKHAHKYVFICCYVNFVKKTSIVDKLNNVCNFERLCKHRCLTWPYDYFLLQANQYYNQNNTRGWALLGSCSLCLSYPVNATLICLCSDSSKQLLVNEPQSLGCLPLFHTFVWQGHLLWGFWGERVCSLWN